MQAKVIIMTDQNESLTEVVNSPTGTTNNPIKENDIRNKFISLVTLAYNYNMVDKILKELYNIDKAYNINHLISSWLKNW